MTVIHEDPECVIEVEPGNIPIVRGREANEPQRITAGVLESAGLFYNVEVIVRFNHSDFRLSDFDGRSWLATPVWRGIRFDYFKNFIPEFVYIEHEDHLLQVKEPVDYFADHHTVRCLTCDVML